jgi:geranylgeranyl diphosphate synthase type I
MSSDTTTSATTTGRPPAPAAVARIRDLVEPALRASVEAIDDERMRLVAGYQLGWCDAEGRPTDSGGKAIRPTLAVLAAEAVSGDSAAGVPGAVAVELVHNFSLLHDDIMDRDVERRHRPTGWVAFGEGQAILGGNAMLTAAVEVVLQQSPNPVAAVESLLATVQHLISGQSADLALEQRDDATLEDVLEMEGGKTAALIAGSLALGAIAAGAAGEQLTRLVESGRLVGLAFQLVDDLLGIVGDPSVTGKSASSDVRAGKRSAPVVAALRSGTDDGERLAELLRDGPPATEEDVARAVELIIGAGGVQWAADEAQRLLDAALEELDHAGLAEGRAADDLREVARYLVHRVW